LVLEVHQAQEDYLVQEVMRDLLVRLVLKETLGQAAQVDQQDYQECKDLKGILGALGH